MKNEPRRGAHPEPAPLAALPPDAAPVPGFACYFVTPSGDVWSEKRGAPRRLKALPNQGGYLFVTLRRDGKHHARKVHSLVLETFVGPRPHGMQCRHLSGDKLDNRIANLAWGTPKENSQDRVHHGGQYRGESNPSARLTADQARIIRASAGTNAAIAARFGVAQSTVSYIRNGKTWRHLEPVR